MPARDQAEGREVLVEDALGRPNLPRRKTAALRLVQCIRATAALAQFGKTTALQGLGLAAILARMAIRLDVFDDFHLHGASSPAWEQRHVQLSPGLMHRALIETASPGLHVFRKTDDCARGPAGLPTRERVRSASAAYVVAACHRLVAASGDVPPDVDALCRRLRTSRHSLQNGFRQVADMIPTHYLRNLRLNAVRQRLLTTPAADLHVSQAAGDAGFEHLGHFGMRYRDLFGELPSQTFRKTASP